MPLERAHPAQTFLKQGSVGTWSSPSRFSMMVNPLVEPVLLAGGEEHILRSFFLVSSIADSQAPHVDLKVASLSFSFRVESTSARSCSKFKGI